MMRIFELNSHLASIESEKILILCVGLSSENHHFHEAKRIDFHHKFPQMENIFRANIPIKAKDKYFNQSIDSFKAF
jgi:hypothetical protein